MDIQRTAREIGLFETAKNLSRVRGSEEVVLKVGAAMPLPDEDTDCRVEQAANWLLNLEKQKYMFMMPEIALIEKMAQIAKRDIDIILAVPSNLDQETKERLNNNIPHGIKVEIMYEPYFHQSFFPGNGLVVISGYMGSNRAMVLHDTYRMVEHYSGFLGKKVFIPYVELDTATRYEGWMELSQQRISAIWRSGI